MPGARRARPSTCTAWSASQSASTARPAVMCSPSVVTTPVARPSRDRDRARRAGRSAPRRPSPVARRTRASVRPWAPPTGTGNPSCWPMHISSQPSSALPDDSGVRSACSAQPAKSSDALSPANSSSVNRRSGISGQPGEVAQPGGPGGAGQPQAAADGWERREQRRQERRTDARPVLVDPLPRRTVAGCAELEVGRRWSAEVPAEDGRRAVGQRVGQDVGGVGPGQPVGLEVQRRDDRRRRGQRVERAEEVVAEAGRGDLAGPHGAARLGVRLEHDHVPALVGEDVGGHQPVGAGTDDDGVGVGSPSGCSAHDGSRSAPALDDGGQALQRLVVADVDRRVHDRADEVAEPAHGRLLLQRHHAPVSSASPTTVNVASADTNGRARTLSLSSRPGSMASTSVLSGICTGPTPTTWWNLLPGLGQPASTSRICLGSDEPPRVGLGIDQDGEGVRRRRAASLDWCRPRIEPCPLLGSRRQPARRRLAGGRGPVAVERLRAAGRTWTVTITTSSVVGPPWNSSRSSSRP